MKYEKFWKEEKYSKIKESETIDYLIAPIMREELGWNREDPEIVKSQWRKVSGSEKENPVDFALFKRGEENPVILLECKRIGEKLEGKNVTQAVTYCLTSNVKWCILTNGMEWKLYDTTDFSKDIIDREVLYVDLRKDGLEKLKCLGLDQIENIENVVNRSKVRDVIKHIDWIDVIITKSGVKDRALVEECYREFIETERTNSNTYLVDLMTHHDWSFSEPISIQITTFDQRIHLPIKIDSKIWADCLIRFVDFFIELPPHDLFSIYDHLIKKDIVGFSSKSQQIYPLKTGYMNAHSSTTEKVRIMKGIAQLYQAQVKIELQYKASSK